jgi:hypothetical protein
MNHRPFEDWLLDDQPLTPEQTRDLQAHLRTCTSCTAIADSNLALHSTGLIAPMAGFVSRFGTRLIARKKVTRIRQFIGTLVFVLSGLALFYWLAGPVIQHIIQSPAEWITTVVSYFIFILTSAQALSEAGRVVLHILPDFISPLGWLILLTLVSALGFLWTISIWRLTRRPQEEYEL